MGSLGERHRVFACKTPGVSGQNPRGFASASKSDADGVGGLMAVKMVKSAAEERGL